MSEKLTNEEIRLLSDALEDGFKDDYLPKVPLTKMEMGKLFATNPLGNEVVYYQTPDPFDEERVRSAASEANRDDDDLFAEESWESELFWRSSFGFNFEKIEAFFHARHYEVIEEYQERYEQYLSDKFANGYEEYERSFNHWIEGRIFPYTKRWFEHHINKLIKRVSWAQEQLRSKTNAAAAIQSESVNVGAQYWSKRLLQDALVLGRMVEHYRWKFQYEAAIVARQRQHSAAGLGGAKASRNRRYACLETLMYEIESLANAVGLVSEDRIVDQALEAARESEPNFPKSKKTLDDYTTTLRSEEPFKSRYEAVFRKNA